MRTKIIRLIGIASMISSFNPQKSNIIIKYNRKLEFETANKTEVKNITINNNDNMTDWTENELYLYEAWAIKWNIDL